MIRSSSYCSKNFNLKNYTSGSSKGLSISSNMNLSNTDVLAFFCSSLLWLSQAPKILYGSRETDAIWNIASPTWTTRITQILILNNLAEPAIQSCQNKKVLIQVSVSSNQVPKRRYCKSITWLSINRFDRTVTLIGFQEIVFVITYVGLAFLADKWYEATFVFLPIYTTTAYQFIPQPEISVCEGQSIKLPFRLFFIWGILSWRTKKYN